ncbi:MAG: aminoglycoside phosphotransferase [Pseudonocardiaceae bacterium]|nr:aminoglycoside phosphotransferase [Pseudonocardiaceae bacterium]
MRHNLGKAADHFGLAVVDEPVFGWRLRSIGANTAGSQGGRWLRVVSEEPRWAMGYAWTGNLDANVVVDVAKPRVLDVFEWPEGDWRQQRAEVMTLIPGAPCSRGDVLRTSPNLSDAWWADLRRSLDTIARTATDRSHADQGRVVERIHGRFGESVDATVTRSATVHGDLHWSNLMRPRFGVLDWELWGRGPEGMAAATLLCYSLLEPSVAATVQTLFADVLDTPTGRVAQLYVVARLLRRVDGGDHPDLAAPLVRHAKNLLDP